MHKFEHDQSLSSVSEVVQDQSKTKETKYKPAGKTSSKKREEFIIWKELHKSKQDIRLLKL